MNASPPTLGTPRKGLRRYIGPKRLTILVVYCAFAVVAWHYWRQGILTPETVFALTSSQPVLAPAIFIAAYALTVLFLIPSLPLNLGAGFVWGPLVGSLYSMLGCMLGSILAFLLARTALGQPLAQRFDNSLLRWLVEEIDEKGWRVVAFVRINPVFPSGPINYLFGLTSLSFASYTWATTVFMYPLCLLMAQLGYSTGGLLINADTKRLIMLLVTVSAVVSVFALGHLFLKRTRLPR